MAQFFHSTEFLVLVFTFAALLIGIIVKPRSRGVAETSFATGELYVDSDPTPRIEFRCTPSGALEISRCGLSGINTSAIAALAITRTGFDISIEERITPGFGAPDQCVRAVFTIEGLPSERYHVSYNSSAYSTFLATTVPLKPGVRFTRYFPS